jgi:hypothetical protein
MTVIPVHAIGQIPSLLHFEVLGCPFFRARLLDRRHRDLLCFLLINCNRDGWS